MQHSHHYRLPGLFETFAAKGRPNGNIPGRSTDYKFGDIINSACCKVIIPYNLREKKVSREAWGKRKGQKIGVDDVAEKQVRACRIHTWSGAYEKGQQNYGGSCCP